MTQVDQEKLESLRIERMVIRANMRDQKAIISEAEKKISACEKRLDDICGEIDEMFNKQGKTEGRENV